jgi:hypothetical protein
MELIEMTLVTCNSSDVGGSATGDITGGFVFGDVVVSVGTTDGLPVRVSLFIEGATDGFNVGEVDGLSLLKEGDTLGLANGLADGVSVCDAVGELVGDVVVNVGAKVGLAVPVMLETSTLSRFGPPSDEEAVTRSENRPEGHILSKLSVP